MTAAHVSRRLPRLLALLLAACSLGAVACGGDEGATPSECEDLPEYVIRNASRDEGAVKRVGTVSRGLNPTDDPPLTGVQQRELQLLAEKGCVTLPGSEVSLTNRGPDAEQARELADAEQ